MSKLFNTDDDQVEEIVIPTDDPLAPFMAKYTDAQGIAKALVAKDAHIKNLERENAEARVEIAARSNVEETVDRLLQAKSVNPPITPGETNPPGQPNGSNTASTGLTAADVEKLLAQREQETKAKANQDYIRKELEARYGKEYPSVVAAKAKEIGESMEFFEALAQTRPAVLLNLLGPAPARQDPVFKPQVLNTTGTALGMTQPATRTQKHYAQLKKTNPAEYFKPKTQNQMYEDSMKLGEAFFDV